MGKWRRPPQGQDFVAHLYTLGISARGYLKSASLIQFHDNKCYVN